MDKLSLKVLKELKKVENGATRKEIIDAFGKPAAKSLSFWESEGYIKSGRIPIGINNINSNLQPVWRSDGQFNITSKG